MATLSDIRGELLVDNKISASAVKRIQQHLEQVGFLTFQDARIMVELLKEAFEVCPEFDELLFSNFREFILKDGRIGMDEQFLLLEMLYSDGEVRDCERRFLADLYRDADEVTPEFKQLCETAFSCDDTDWELGGS